MCNRFILHYPWNLRYVPDRCNTQEMYNNTVEAYSKLLEFIPNCYVGQMCENGVDSHLWLFENVTNQLKTPEMCERTVKDDPCLLKYQKHPPDVFCKKRCSKMYIDRYKTRKLWGKELTQQKK